MFKTKKARSVPAAFGEVFTSSEVSKVSGVSLRQLQWWDERGVVSPQQDGHRRVYTSQEVLEVSVIAALRQKGFSLQKIRRVLRFLHKDIGKKLSEVASSSSDVHLLTDGKNIYLEDDPGRVIDVLKNAKQPMFLVCVTDQLRRLNAVSPKPARSETVAGSRKEQVG